MSRRSPPDEGVVKYQLDFMPGEPVPAELIRHLNAWRQLCRTAGLIGRDDARYGGVGFGNMSRRYGDGDAFISGTQTGGLSTLTAEHYALVRTCFPAENRVVATGPIRPSSEAMTHAAVYAADSAVQVVIHAHAPRLWRRAAHLDLPTTAADVPYGTPQMSAEVGRLFAESDVRARRIFAMGGHEDGIVAFGSDAESAGTILFAAVAAALAVMD